MPAFATPRRLPPPTLEAVVEQARSDLALPPRIARLLGEGGFDRPVAADVAALLRSDPQLLGHVKRWAKSRFFTDRQSAESLEATAASLGPTLTSRLVLLAAVYEHFQPDHALGTYARTALWSHSVTVGVLSELIARMCGLADPSVAFFAGALHDVGLLALERVLPMHFGMLIDRLDHLTATDDAERELANWDHTQLGAALLDDWGFPQPITDAARYHHLPEEYRGTHGELVAVVCLANYLTSRMGRPALGLHNVAPASDVVFQALAIDARLLTLAVQATEHALEAALELS